MKIKVTILFVLKWLIELDYYLHKILSSDIMNIRTSYFMENVLKFTVFIVLLTLLVRSANSTNMRLDLATSSSLKAIPLTISTSSLLASEEEVDLPSNAPLLPCGSAGGVEDGEYIDVYRQYMDPVCENVQGYCRLKRNQNYTAILGFTPKVEVQSLTVKVTGVRAYGWETQFWPEYGICGRFNLTCPQEANVPVQAMNNDKVPDKVPPTKGLYRLRLLGTSTEDDNRKPYLCRQIYLQFY